MKKRSSILRKCLIGLGVLLILSLVLGFFFLRVFHQYKDEYNVQYASLEFKFPAHLRIHQLQLEPQGLKLKIDEVDVMWEWKPLTKRNIVIEHLSLSRAEIILLETGKGAPGLKIKDMADKQEESAKELKGFSIDLNDIALNQISFCSLDREDTIQVYIPSLRLNQLQLKDSLLIDSLLINEGTVHYAYYSNKNDDVTATLAFHDLPEFRLNYIELNHNRLQYSQADQNHSLTQLDLKLKGWKKTDLLDFNVEKLTFTYQDTLDLALVVEEGEVAENLDAHIQDVNLNLPGIALNITEVKLNNQNDLNASIALGKSSISMGTLKRFTPIILVAMDPQIPDDSLVRFEGHLSFHNDQLSFDSFPFRLMSQTHSNMVGRVDWSGDSILFDLKFDDIHTSREDLYAFLIEEDYNEFFLWPSDVNGKGTIKGNLNYFDMRGTLATRQGLLNISSLVTFDQDDNMFYSIALDSDSVLVSEIVDYLPLQVPYGQVNMFIGGTLNNDETEDTLRMDVSSQTFMAEGRIIHNLDLTYYFNNQYDSMWVNLNDDQLLADFQGAYYSGDTSQVAFHGNIQMLSSELLTAALPDQMLQTNYSGSYEWYGDDYYQILLETDSSKITPYAYDPVRLPSSQLMYREDIDTMTVDLRADEQTVFHLATSNELFNVSIDSADWLKGLPDTQAFLSLAVDSLTLIKLTGISGELNIDEARFQKTQDKWEALIQAPLLRYDEIIIDSVHLSLKEDSTFQNGVMHIASIENPYLNLDSLWVDIIYEENQYQLDAKSRLTQLDEDVSFGLQLLNDEEQYLIRMADDQPLVIAGKAWEVKENHGLSFNSGYSLRSGSLRLQNQSTSLRFATQDDGILKFGIDSLNLGEFINTIDTSLIVLGNMSAELLYDPVSSLMQWNGMISHIRAGGLEVGDLSSDGLSKGDTLNASVKLDYMDTHAFIDFDSKGEGIINYTANVNDLDISFLQNMHVWPENMSLSGILAADVNGVIDSTFKSDGYLILKQADLALNDVSASMHIVSDTLYFNNDQLELKDFVLHDYQNNSLTLKGTLKFHPELFADIQVQSENFQALHEQNRNAYVKGNLGLSSDLSITGSTENLTVFGLLKVLPGAYVNYTYQGNINVVDASQTVSFVEFDKLDLSKDVTQSKPNNPINWNVNLDIENSTLEILLNEVTQEYVRLNGGGQIRLRGGNSNTPMVYGSLTTSSGRALIFPPVIPDLDLDVQQTSVDWNGVADNPELSFRGVETVQASPKGLSSALKDRIEPVGFEVLVILDKTDLDHLSPRFDVQSTDGQVNNILQSLGEEQREKYAIDLLVFGSIGSESVAGASKTLEPVVSKLNEIANRNLKNTDVSFGVVNYDNGQEGDNTNTQTNINYKVSRGLFRNRMFFSIGGDVGVFNNTAAGVNNMPSAHLIGNIEIGYRISEKPAISLIGARKNVYEGVIDGDVTRSSLGLNFRKTYRNFNDIFGNKKGAELE